MIISDLRLADGEGLDIVRAARAGPRPLPVIVVTGYASEERRRAALAAGATAFFAKPFLAAALLASVRTHLGRSVPED
ncbi:MAG TPA: response regulator [Methylomirabilota bacterium]|nr:response regulator [Methylomirabilota bacterium]